MTLVRCRPVRRDLALHGHEFVAPPHQPGVFEALIRRRCARRFCLFSSARRSAHLSGGPVLATGGLGVSILAVVGTDGDSGILSATSSGISFSVRLLDLRRHRPNARLVPLAFHRIHVVWHTISNKEVPHRPETSAAERELLSALEYQFFRGRVSVRMFALVNAGLRNTFPRQERLGLRSRCKHWFFSEPRL